MIAEHKPGTLVNYRGRDWIVMPSDDSEVLNIKPLGGSDQEMTGVYLPLMIEGQEIQNTEIAYPEESDLGDFPTAKLLFNASRLSFRNAAGPFRCMGKLSFRPRSYQMIPLVMALKQNTTRLLIADDVGIGKTVEALMILKESMERGEVNRFSVICLPHLCEQWKSELKDKLDINAEIIRSSTIAGLERRIPDDRSAFYHYPYQVISIDYIKQASKRGIYLTDAPEFIIVDEAHTCAKPAGASSNNSQLRYSLLREIADDEKKHLLLLTATPHSGKNEEFQSLLGLLDKKFETLDIENLSQTQRRQIARHFVQRKRANIRRWLNQETPFPDRDTKEIAYGLDVKYKQFYDDVLRFAREITSKEGGSNKRRTNYWAALALLRGVMSSPLAGLEMLKSRRDRQLESMDVPEENPILKAEYGDSDVVNSNFIQQLDLEHSETELIDSLIAQVEDLQGIEKDRKVEEALKQVKTWVGKGVNPIVFCRYIATAKYVGAVLKEYLGKKVEVQVITSEFADEQRKEMIDAMKSSPKRVLVATDCLSEGINLQEHFTAVLHYDLPWNPNRLEQREGRVDRFGQAAKTVYTHLLYGKDNPIDVIVLKVLIRKVRDIQKAIGVSIVIGDEKSSIMDSVMKEVLTMPSVKSTQGEFDFGGEYRDAETRISNELETAKSKAEKLKSIFAHESIKPESIEKELKEVDEVIGDVDTVEHFIVNTCRALGASVTKTIDGYELNTFNLPEYLKLLLPDVENIPLSFSSPTPVGRVYIGRNHKFVEQLAQLVMANAFAPQDESNRISRAAVVQTDAVEKRTTIVQFRVRNVIKEVARKKELIAEEMYLWGYEGSYDNRAILDYTRCKGLLQEAKSTGNLSRERQQQIFNRVKEAYDNLKGEIQELAEERANHLVESHGRFKELVGGNRYEAVHPVLPPDVMGIYVLMPKPKSN